MPMKTNAKKLKITAEYSLAEANLVIRALRSDARTIVNNTNNPDERRAASTMVHLADQMEGKK